MALRSYRLELYTPDGPIWEGEVVSIIAPGLDGYFGVWAHHQPMIAALRIGELIVRLPDGKVEFFATHGGFLEVHREGVRILADMAEHRDEIDVDRATRNLAEAEEKLNQLSADPYAAFEPWEIEELRLQRERNLTRLKVVKRQSPPV